jgi:ABC-type microcin C transport system duplicated ATPase subunit YejF
MCRFLDSLVADTHQLSYLLITLDLAVVRQLTDQSLVMQRGEVVEQGPTVQLLDQPQHP